MEIRRKKDGRLELDWNPPSGPYITITELQWRQLVSAIKTATKGEPSK